MRKNIKNLSIERLEKKICMSASAMVAPLQNPDAVLFTTAQHDQLTVQHDHSDFIYFVPDSSTGQLPRFGVQHPADTGTDWITDAAANPTFVAPLGISNWSDWENQLDQNSVVLIPVGSTVIYDSDYSFVKTIGVKGELEFDSTKNTELHLGTIMVYDGGHLKIENHNRNVKTNVVFDGVLNLTEDPSQSSIGLVAIGGHVHIEGAELASTFSYLNSKAVVGVNTISVKDITNWAVGDELFFADTQVGSTTQTYKRQDERRFITEINDNTVTLNSPLTYEHDKEGYIGNLTRNVTFSSAAGSQGHALFAGSAEVSVKYAAFVNMGRTEAKAVNDTKFDLAGNLISIGTNQRGRYALHAHHLENAFIFEGNAIDGGIKGNNLKWGIALHQTYGTITKNVVASVGGSGIASEDGTETGIISYNLVIGTNGGSGVNDVTIVNALPQERLNNSFGHGGFGYWFASPLLNVYGNVAAGSYRREGFSYWLFGKEGLKLHEVNGQDLSYITGVQSNVLNYLPFNPSSQRIVSFHDNFADVSLGTGFISYYSNAGNWSADRFNVKIRGLQDVGFLFYYSSPLLVERNLNQTLSNSTIIGPYDLGVSVNKLPKRQSEPNYTRSLGVDGNPGGATGVIRVVNTEIRGFDVGVFLGSGGADVIDSTLNNFRDIYIPTAPVPGVQVNIVSTKFGTLSSVNVPHQNIYLQDFLTQSPNHLAQLINTNDMIGLIRYFRNKTDVRVYDYNKTGQDFQIYYDSQNANFIIPILGITNQVAYDKYGVSFGNILPPVTTKMTGIIGSVAPISSQLPTAWNMGSMISTVSNYTLTYRAKLTYYEPGVISTWTENVKLVPGLNIFTRNYTFGGQTYKTSFLIWGNFSNMGTPKGDANLDGIIDGLDYTIWADNFGKTTLKKNLSGDFNGDGVVDGLDYTIWADNFGK